MVSACPAFLGRGLVSESEIGINQERKDDDQLDLLCRIRSEWEFVDGLSGVRLTVMFMGSRL